MKAEVKDYKTIWASAYGVAFVLVGATRRGQAQELIAAEAAVLAHQAVKEALTIKMILPENDPE